jgi:chromosome segregation ATPase
LNVDKQNIELAIAELDRKKNETLMETFTKVNLYFGNIFSTLLPGA